MNINNMETLRCFISELDSENRNWKEDADHENGNYENHCFECGMDFIGHKRRPTCRKCWLKYHQKAALKFALAEIILLREIILESNDMMDAYKTRFPGDNPHATTLEIKEQILNTLLAFKRADYTVFPDDKPTKPTNNQE